MGIRPAASELTRGGRRQRPGSAALSWAVESASLNVCRQTLIASRQQAFALTAPVGALSYARQDLLGGTVGLPDIRASPEPVAHPQLAWQLRCWLALRCWSPGCCAALRVALATGAPPRGAAVAVPGRCRGAVAGLRAQRSPSWRRPWRAGLIRSIMSHEQLNSNSNSNS